VSRQDPLDLARALRRDGYASSLALAQAESEYRATAQVVPQLALAIERQEHALSLLMGASPGPVVRGARLADIGLPGSPTPAFRRD
jgi:outer membrane protein TolC